MRLFIAEKPELGRAIAEGLDGNYKSGRKDIYKKVIILLLGLLDIF